MSIKLFLKIIEYCEGYKLNKSSHELVTVEAGKWIHWIYQTILSTFEHL